MDWNGEGTSYGRSDGRVECLGRLSTRGVSPLDFESSSRDEDRLTITDPSMWSSCSAAASI